MAANRRRSHRRYDKLNAVVIVVFIAVAEIFRRAHGAAILGVMNFDSSVHVRDADVSAPAAQFTLQIVTDEIVVIYV
jgi:hypothetical protein